MARSARWSSLRRSLADPLLGFHPPRARALAPAAPSCRKHAQPALLRHSVRQKSRKRSPRAGPEVKPLSFPVRRQLAWEFRFEAMAARRLLLLLCRDTSQVIRREARIPAVPTMLVRAWAIRVRTCDWDAPNAIGFCQKNARGWNRNRAESAQKFPPAVNPDRGTWRSTLLEGPATIPRSRQDPRRRFAQLDAGLPVGVRQLRYAAVPQMRRGVVLPPLSSRPGDTSTATRPEERRLPVPSSRKLPQLLPQMNLGLRFAVRPVPEIRPVRDGVRGVHASDADRARAECHLPASDRHYQDGNLRPP